MAKSFCCSTLQVVSQIVYSENHVTLDLAVFTAQLNKACVPFAQLVTDCFRYGNCCELLPLSPLFLSATLLPGLGLGGCMVEEVVAVA